MKLSDLEPYLKTRWLGRRAIFAEELASTNKTAMELGAEGEAKGLIITAEKQTAGRGRHARTWHSPAGLNLYLSLLIRPSLQQYRIPELAMLTAIALRQAILSIEPDLPIGLKWPNDLWVQQRKVSGILCEAASTQKFGLHTVVGVGLNINSTLENFPEELQNTATSLKIATGKNYSRAKILAAFLNIFEKQYDLWENSIHFDPFIKIWNSHDILVGRQIELCQKDNIIKGTVLGISQDGRLQLRKEDQTECLINAGDVHILGAVKK